MHFSQERSERVSWVPQVQVKMYCTQMENEDASRVKLSVLRVPLKIYWRFGSQVHSNDLYVDFVASREQSPPHRDFQSLELLVLWESFRRRQFGQLVLGSNHRTSFVQR